MTFLEAAPLLDADPRVLRCHLLLIAYAHKTHRPNAELSFLLMSYHEFLLRLPSALQKVLVRERAGRNVVRINLQDYETKSIESKNLALRFEPWTSDYRLAVSALIATGMLKIDIVGAEQDWKVIPTDAGCEAAQAVGATDAFSPTLRRAEIIVKTLDIKIKTLRGFIDRSLPENISLELRSGN